VNPATLRLLSLKGKLGKKKEPASVEICSRRRENGKKQQSLTFVL